MTRDGRKPKTSKTIIVCRVVGRRVVLAAKTIPTTIAYLSPLPPYDSSTTMAPAEATAEAEATRAAAGRKRRSSIPLRRCEVALTSLLLEGGVAPEYHPLPPWPLPPTETRTTTFDRNLWNFFLGGSAFREDDSTRQSPTTEPQVPTEATAADAPALPSPAAAITPPAADPSPPSSACSWTFPERVWGTRPGQLSNLVRANRKEDQIRSVLRCVAPLLTAPLGRPSTTTDERTPTTPITVVDFGGGTGHLSIPLSRLFPHCQILVVDLNERSLQLLHTQAQACCADGKDRKDGNDCESPSNNAPMPPDALPLHQQYPGVIQATAIPNLFTLCGPIQVLAHLPRMRHHNNHNPNNATDPFPFDVGVALHLCGEATDAAFRLCVAVGASLVAVPCCVGKLRSDRNDPYRFQATGSNNPSISYPQSQLYQTLWDCHQSSNPQGACSVSSSADLWNALARAADCCGSGGGDGENGRGENGRGENDDRPEQPPHRPIINNAARRIAKALLEWDRCLFLKEQPLGGSASLSASSDTGSPVSRPYCYSRVILTKLEPQEASPKNDVIVAVATRPSAGGIATSLPWGWQWPILCPLNGTVDGNDCQANDDFARDLQWTLQHLRIAGMEHGSTGRRDGAVDDPHQRCDDPSLDPTAPFDDSTQNGRHNGEEDKHILQSRVDWTQEDEQDVERLLRDRFFGHSNPVPVDTATTTDVYIFPPHLLGRRRRKLVHTVADKLGLEHWSYGRRQGGRTVAVALPGTRRKIISER